MNYQLSGFTFFALSFTLIERGMAVKRKRFLIGPVRKIFSNRAGFTIVELLTALVIIAILTAILIPSLALVRNTARETRQRAQFTTIALALTAFKSDHGDYPRSDCPSPPGNYCGAQKLTEALLGRDLLGFHPKSNWDAIDTTFYPTDPIELDESLKKRIGPYLELATANAFRLGTSAPGKRDGLFDDTLPLEKETFVLCDVFGFKKITLTPGKTVKAGAPVLYYKANTSSKNIDDPDFKKRIYNAYDNFALIKLKSRADGKLHPFIGPTGIDSFYEYIHDPKIAAKKWPYRPDSYILISAGVDGVYGTSDDITNFAD